MRALRAFCSYLSSLYNTSRFAVFGTGLQTSIAEPRAHRCGGFSTIELLVSVAIIIVIVGTALINFSSFNSTVLLKNAAYTVAVDIRQAQAFGLSVRGDGTGKFRVPYGIEFTNNADTYDLKVGNEAWKTTSPYVPIPNPSNLVERFKLGNTIHVVEICVVVSTSPENCNIGSLYISFARPNFDAFFYADAVAVAIGLAVANCDGP